MSVLKPEEPSEMNEDELNAWLAGPENPFRNFDFTKIAGTDVWAILSSGALGPFDNLS